MDNQNNQIPLNEEVIGQSASAPAEQEDTTTFKPVKDEAPKKQKKEKAPKEKKEKKEKNPIELDLKKLVAFVGIGALCLAGIASLIAAVIPGGSLNYAILGVLCITSAASIIIQLSSLASINEKPDAPKCNAEEKLSKELEMAKYEIINSVKHEIMANACANGTSDAEVEALKAELDKEKEILGSLFELDDYVVKNKRFHAERNRQFEAKRAMDEIEEILEKSKSKTLPEVRVQYLDEIESVFNIYKRDTDGTNKGDVN